MKIGQKDYFLDTFKTVLDIIVKKPAQSGM